MPCYAHPLHVELTSKVMQTLLSHSDFPQKIATENDEVKMGSRGNKISSILPGSNVSNIHPLLAIEWLRDGSNFTAAEMFIFRHLLHRPLSPSQDELSEAALMHRLYPDSLLFHSLFWPLTIILCGLLLIGLAYAIDGCRVWRTDMTVIA